MAVLKKRKTSNFTTMSNTILSDGNISFKAKGLLFHMMSLPDDWQFYESELAKRSKDGISSVRSGLQELIEAGYLVKKRARDEQGRVQGNDWIVSDEPILNELDEDGYLPELENHIQESPELEKPNLEKPNLDFPNLENRTLLNTNTTKDSLILNTNNTNEQSDDCPSESKKSASKSELKNRFENLWALYPNKKGKDKAFKSYQAAIKKGVTDEEIKAGLVAYKKEIEAKSTPRRFIAHGSTWFNQSRWEDSYDTRPDYQLSGHKSEPTPEWFQQRTIYNNQTDSAPQTTNFSDEASQARMRDLIASLE